MKTLRSGLQLHSEIYKLKKGFALSAVIAAVCAMFLYLLFNPPFAVFKRNKSDVCFRTNGKAIETVVDGKAQPFEIKGVNIGTGYPGVFPNEYGIDKKTYSRWFEMIGEMNANTVRVYKIQSPDFYKAFAEYNKSHDKKLYLIQGVDFSEDVMYSKNNILESKYKQRLFKETYKAVDALHGNGTVLDKKTKMFSVYTADVSEYVLGYVLGIEWDEIYVSYICRINENIQSYKGKYVYSQDDANPFEIFLSEWGDKVLDYENGKYGAQKLISFANWPETDPFDNELDPRQGVVEGVEKNTESFVDIEKIKLTDKVQSGLFASYNVYPYFPRFLQDGPYTEFVDETGRKNPYRKYLTELTNYHSYPVVVTEYGVPSSRNEAYYDVHRGLSHGGLTEKEQGAALVTLYEDIQKAGCAGSIAFSWQDEWYKKIWNEKALSDPDGRAYWSNAQSAEQFYGLLAFEPGDGKEENYPDGDLSEWTERDIVSDNGKTKLSMKSDEKYVYFMAEGLDKREGNNSVKIALDVTPKAGALKQGAAAFERPVDFIIKINSNGESSVSVQDYSDLLIYTLHEGNNGMDVDTLYNLAAKYGLSASSKPDSERFVTVSRSSDDVHGLEKRKKLIDKVGVLEQGNTNPKSENYNPNADYFIGDNFVEIRIPWQFLNFTNPSKREIVDDYRKTNFKIKGLEISKIHSAAYYDGDTEVSEFGAYKLKDRKKPEFYERLKDSYYALQKAFEG